MYKVTLLKFALVIMLLASFIPIAAAHAQSDPLVTVTITEASVEPGQPITINWVVSSHVRRFHHVAIELNHPSIFGPITVTATGRTGSTQMIIPANYFDIATIDVYPQKSNNQNYLDAAGKTIFAHTEVVVDDGVVVELLTITPNPVPRGQAVTVTWEVTYGDNPVPAVTIVHLGNEDFYVNITDLPPVGSVDIPIPEYYTETFGVRLVVEKTMGASVQTSLVCPFDNYYSQAGSCPISQTTTPMTFQYFEKGILVLSQGAVFVLMNPSTAYSRTAITGDLSGIVAPEGLYLPDAAFSGVWLQYRDQLGFGTSAAGTFSTVFETHPDSYGRHKAISYWFQLPDGEIIYINVMGFKWSMQA